MGSLPPLDTDAYVAVLHLTSLYCHIVDTEDWGDLDQLFTEDATFDLSANGMGVAEGIEAIRRQLPTLPRHTTHHALNPLLTSVVPGRAVAVTKYLSVWHDGKFGSGEYHTVNIETPAGWRVQRHACIVLRSLEAVSATDFPRQDALLRLPGGGMTTRR